MASYGPYGGFTGSGGFLLIKFEEVDGKFLAFYKKTEQASWCNQPVDDDAFNHFYAYDAIAEAPFCFILDEGCLYRAPLVTIASVPRVTAVYSPPTEHCREWRLVGGRLARHYGVDPQRYVTEAQVPDLLANFPSLSVADKVLRSSVEEVSSEIDQAYTRWRSGVHQDVDELPTPAQQGLIVMELNAAWNDVAALSHQEKRVLLQAICNQSPVRLHDAGITNDAVRVINEFRQMLFPNVLAQMFDNARFYSNDAVSQRTTVASIQLFIDRLLALVAVDFGLTIDLKQRRYAMHQQCAQYCQILDAADNENRFVLPGMPKHFLYSVLADEDDYGPLFSALLSWHVGQMSRDVNIQILASFKQHLVDLKAVLSPEYDLVHRAQCLFPGANVYSMLMSDVQALMLQVEIFQIDMALSVPTMAYLKQLDAVVTTADSLAAIVKHNDEFSDGKLRIYLQSKSTEWRGFVHDAISLQSMVFMLQRFWSDETVDLWLLGYDQQSLRSLLTTAKDVSDVLSMVANDSTRKSLLERLSVAYLGLLVVDQNTLESMVSVLDNNRPAGVALFQAQLAQQVASEGIVLAFLTWLGGQKVQSLLPDGQAIRAISTYLSPNELADYLALVGEDHINRCCHDLVSFVSLYLLLRRSEQWGQYDFGHAARQFLVAAVDDFDAIEPCLLRLLESPEIFWLFVKDFQHVTDAEGNYVMLQWLQAIDQGYLFFEFLGNAALILVNLEGVNGVLRAWLFDRIDYFQLMSMLSSDTQALEMLLIARFQCDMNELPAFSGSQRLLWLQKNLYFSSVSTLERVLPPNTHFRLDQYDDLVTLLDHIQFAHSCHQQLSSAYQREFLRLVKKVMDDIDLCHLLEGKLERLICVLQRLNTVNGIAGYGSLADYLLTVKSWDQFDQVVEDSGALAELIIGIIGLPGGQEVALQRVSLLFDHFLSVEYLNYLAEYPHVVTGVIELLTYNKVSTVFVDCVQQKVSVDSLKRPHDEMSTCCQPMREGGGLAQSSMFQPPPILSRHSSNSSTCSNS